MVQVVPAAVSVTDTLELCSLQLPVGSCPPHAACVCTEQARALLCAQVPAASAGGTSCEAPTCFSAWVCLGCLLSLGGAAGLSCLYPAMLGAERTTWSLVSNTAGGSAERGARLRELWAQRRQSIRCCHGFCTVRCFQGIQGSCSRSRLPLLSSFYLANPLSPCPKGLIELCVSAEARASMGKGILGIPHLPVGHLSRNVQWLWECGLAARNFKL